VTGTDDTPATGTAAIAPPAAKRVRVEFLFLDLTNCTRCRGTDESLESALAVARDFAAAGTEVEVHKIHVESAEQARELRVEGSPTIRVNGRDVAPELRESSCGSQACIDGCGESIACRVWLHGGEEYTKPPVAMILDAILRELYGGTVVQVQTDAKPYELPDNLARFFDAKVSARTAGEAAVTDCCPLTEQRSCCDPEDKAECCGASSGEGCGCR
jgi:Domain of unknown function (DUF2703)